MRKLEQQMAGIRAACRRLASRVPLAEPRWQRPARLVIRLSDGDLADVQVDGDPFTPDRWRQLLVSAVDWLGPTRVTVIHHGGPLPPVTGDIIRFMHRLECRVGLQTDGVAIDSPVAEDLLDRGLAQVQILVGGVSDRVQRATVGNSATEATSAAQAFIAARNDRGAPLDVEIGIPWTGPANTELRAIIGWARQVGADGFRIVAPYEARDLPADPEVLDAIADEPASFNRTPAATLRELHTMVAHQDGQPGMARKVAPPPRRKVRCPVGGQRLVITAHGVLYSCPFKDPIGPVGESLPQAWSGAGAHLRAIRACPRACVHPELAVEPILRSPGR